MSPADPSRGRPVVTAVIVAHDGARWLPRLLSTLEAQTRLPDRLVAVDTGSRDGSGEMLARALGADAVVTTDRDRGYGAAVAAGLASLDGAAGDAGAYGDDAEHWVWLLHDDMALDPHALANLLAAARTDVALLGPKVREWPQRRRLLEMGLTVSGTARRLTGVEPGEYDQGQHDRVRDTLAVGSAGMLVRRAAWDRLGGFDPALPLFADDLDLGWRAAGHGMRAAVAPQAVVFHAEASARGQRSIDAAAGGPHRLARAHALYAVLVNCRAPVLAAVAVRLLLGSLLRALGLLLLKAPREAWDEVSAAAAVLG
ncbi:MAG: glycosyltransferase family 2 protein, partial [Actinomycetota bacterium]|nr:glycosyltransferase family 2 protein [Actinomycetota bacterium]